MDADVHFPDGPVAGDAVVSGHSYRSPFKHKFAPTIQQIKRNAIAAGNSGNILAVIKDLFNDPQLLSRRLAPTTATVGDEFNLRHMHVLKDILKPPLSCPPIFGPHILAFYMTMGARFHGTEALFGRGYPKTVTLSLSSPAFAQIEHILLSDIQATLFERVENECSHGHVSIFREVCQLPPLTFA